MGLQYADLNEVTRAFVVEEMRRDLGAGTLYYGRRLSEAGRAAWPSLLEEALRFHDDDWLATRLREGPGFFVRKETRQTKNGVVYADVPVTAPDTLAEGEFNRMYCRGLCAFTVSLGLNTVIVYRAKAVARPRPESEAILGRSVDAVALLTDLRAAQGVEPALGIPPGPNSGLSVRLAAEAAQALAMQP